MEILTQHEGGPLTKAYINARVRHGPTAYMENQTRMSASAMTRAAYDQNIKNISGLKVKLLEFQKTGQSEKAERGNVDDPGSRNDGPVCSSRNPAREHISKYRLSGAAESRGSAGTEALN
ncbi:hypothetical protein [Bdellovibrio bacteriovorus]|uniref:hypothetical protein n=1 Tax=Bdellovibrio bacteriovorus TaxID=959 RepID=UPI003D003F9A